jgi:hypothetical protein
MQNHTEENALYQKLVRQRSFLLYRLDQAKRLISTNEPGIAPGDAPPQLYMCIGNDEFVYHYRKDVPQQIKKDLDLIVMQIKDLSAFESYEGWENFQHLVFANRNYELEAGPAFILPHELKNSRNIIEVNQQNRAILKAHFKYTWENLEHLTPCSAKTIQGNAVAICRSVRKSENVYECGVDTIERYRGRGYGTAIVADWARQVRKNGHIPGYSTQWANRASIALAKKLNAIQYALDLSIV